MDRTKRSAKPLQGIRVLEIGSVVLAPYAAQILADMGASVIKIEPPAGDNTRQLGYLRHPGAGTLFLNCNRGKRSIVLDLKHRGSAQVLERLVGHADVLIHNLRPDAAARVGLDYARVAAINQRIVYCGTYGFGAAGRLAPLAAYDDVIQAACGLAALQADTGGEPGYAPTVVADKTTALFVALGVMGALMRRGVDGAGEQIEVAMYETMVHFMSIEHLGGLSYADAPGPPGYQRILNDYRRPYRTRDGYMAVLPYNSRNWMDFFAAAGRPEVMQQPRFQNEAQRAQHIAELYRIVGEVLPEKTTAQWTAICQAHDIAHSPVNSLSDLVHEPHLQDVGFWHLMIHPTEGALRVPSFPVRLGGPGGDASPAGPAPGLGEHTEAILLELGFSRAEVARLAQDGGVHGLGTVGKELPTAGH